MPDIEIPGVAMKSLEMREPKSSDSGTGGKAPQMGHQSEEAEALGRQVGVGFALEI